MEFGIKKKNAVHIVSILHMDGVFRMLRRVFALFAATALMATGLFAASAALEQRQLADQLIRLHVRANSDSQADQSLKLAVRDGILKQVTELTADCTSPAQAAAVLSEHLSALQAAAEEVLRQEGCNASVSVRLGQEEFPRRDYETFSLPAGRYTSLSVAIGAGVGHNWWCVAFPALCLPATTDEMEQAAAAAGFSQEQTDLLTGQQTTVELKFRALELLQQLKQWLKSL